MQKPRSIMEQKFIRDYFEADEIDNAIITRRVRLSEGVEILIRLIKKIEDDFRLLDQDTYTEIMGKIKTLNSQGKDNKNKMKEAFEKKENTDSYDEENFHIQLKNEDHETCQRILLVIAEMAYHKGWLE